MDIKMLEAMSEMDIRKIDKTSLTDIRDVTVNPNEPIEERIKNYLYSIKNPYCFMSGDIAVQISFSSGGKTLDDALKRYLSVHIKS